MDAKSACRRGCVTLSTFLAWSAGWAAAGELSVTVTGPDGAAIAGAVVVAQSTAGEATAPRSGQKAVMDQRDLQFVPEVLVIQTGTVVSFPNSDQVRHQVYSFSEAKKFQLPLYAGRDQTHRHLRSRRTGHAGLQYPRQHGGLHRRHRLTLVREQRS